MTDKVDAMLAKVAESLNKTAMPPADVLAAPPRRLAHPEVKV